jgi:hypothetical protein
MTNLTRFALGVIGFFLLIVLPVFWYLKRRGQTDKRLVLSILAIWIIFTLFHAPVHEMSHLFAGRLVGQHTVGYQLIQYFWQGDFTDGHITWQGGEQWQFLVSTQAPYLIDALFILLGFFLLRLRAAFTPFVGALILTLTFLRPVFDVATNYAAGAVSGSGDFGLLFSGYPHFAVHAGAWLIMLLGVAGAALTIKGAERTDPIVPR